MCFTICKAEDHIRTMILRASPESFLRTSIDYGVDKLDPVIESLESSVPFV